MDDFQNRFVEIRDLADYEQFVSDLSNASLNDDELIKNFALGLCGEAGEVADLLKKEFYHSPQKLTRLEFLDKLSLEFGDVLFYLTGLIMLHGFTLEEVMKRNITKLDQRHINRKFSGNYHD